MSKIIDYMTEIGLNSLEQTREYFLNNELQTIVQFHEYIQDLSFDDWNISEYSPYSFAPAMELCGFGGCAEYHCKLKRATTFNKFVALYSDTVYFIVDSITNPHIPEFENDDEKEFLYRYGLMCDYSLILVYSKLIAKGIAKIIPPHFSICPDCFAKHVCKTEDFSALSPLIEQYSNKAVLEALNYDTKTKNGCVVIKNLPEIFPNHDAYVNVFGEQAISVMEQLHSFPAIITDKQFKTSFIESHIVDSYITTRFESFISSAYQSKYITDKPLNKEIIDASSKGTIAKLTPPIFEMPFLEAIDTDTILKLRDSEYHAFNEYRVAMDKATHAYISSTEHCEAKDIYDDIIYPAFVNLDAMFERSKKMKVFKNIGEFLVSSATVTLGVMNSIIPENAPAIITALGGTEVMAKYLTNTIERKLKIGNEIEQQDFYFLWKLNRKK